LPIAVRIVEEDLDDAADDVEDDLDRALEGVEGQ
jgi:hypothetical protein